MPLLPRSACLLPLASAFILLAVLPPAPSASQAPHPALSTSADGSWTQLTPAGTPPTPRLSHTAIYDSTRDRMVVIGGWDGFERNDVWALSLAGTPTWAQLAPAGTPPSGRELHTAIHDRARDRIVVFGGFDGSLHNDVWALSLAGTPTWTQLAPAGTPPSPRYYHTAIYDPARDRMVVFGGDDAIIGRGNVVWALSLAGTPTWAQLAPTGTPPSPHAAHTAIYDPVRDRMVVFGGVDNSSYLNDVWALSLAGTPAWAQLAPEGTLPSGRQLHTAIYDLARDRMVTFAGRSDGGLLRDVWALSLAGTPAWTELAPAGTPPSAREFHTAIYHPVGDRMVVYGGIDETGNLPDDVWTVAWGEPLAVPRGNNRSEAAMLAAFPNPTGGALAIAFAVPRSEAVRLAVYDLAGRWVRTLWSGLLAGQVQSIQRWDGRDGNGQTAESGVYFVSLEGRTVHVMKRVVLLP